ncbi:hypothetical protein [Gracilimonas tropica]|uniref:hypothetical protein n=1 Tax=Gracilimonas tropica TaxID=454600 RepID=UPI0003829811|nr:hypothetical protein [Gracilimonas tropica]
MKKFSTHIPALFLFVAVIGTMLSMFHYHSAGLECLHHAEEQHYVQNEVVCPVSGIIAVTGAEAQPQFDELFRFPDTIADYAPLYLSAQPYPHVFGRAPPVVI